MSSTVRVITQTARRVHRKVTVMFVELFWALLLMSTGFVFETLIAVIRGWKL